MVTNTNQRVPLLRRTVRERVEVLVRLASSNPPAFMSALPGALEDRSPTVRERAATLVIEHRLAEALPLIERLLKDKNHLVRHDAAACLGILGDSGSVVQGLRALLADESALVRAQAAESVGLLGDKNALPRLARLLWDRTPYVRSYAASAIGCLGGVAYLKRIREILGNERSDQARSGMLEALFLLGERSVLRELLGLLESPDYHIRCGAANALEVMPLNSLEKQAALTALRKANRKPLFVADGSTAKRVLRTLKRDHKSQNQNRVKDRASQRVNC
jgi:HEAT repeat protein